MTYSLIFAGNPVVFLAEEGPLTGPEVTFIFLVH